MHQVFYERLVPHVDPAMAALAQLVWEREGEARPNAGVEQLLAVSQSVVDYFADLAQSPLPAAWEPLPVPNPLAGTLLSNDERQLLHEALAAADREGPGVRLILFGSRALGTARPDSVLRPVLHLPE